MKLKLPARDLAIQLLSAHKRFLPSDTCTPGCCCRHFNNEQRKIAVEMLTTHIEAMRRLGTPGSLKVAATDTIFLASLNERAYEPLPSYTHSASSSLSDAHIAAWTEDL
ncbi:MAG TPA: hypothetical protein VEF04_07945 [Blastocatellia bacterium]|nr:hypothetical protein [Blastocatellia bacterium]